MKILVSNAGSTSLKFKLFDMEGEKALCEIAELCLSELQQALRGCRRGFALLAFEKRNVTGRKFVF